MQFADSSSFAIEFVFREIDGASYFVPAYAKHRPACKRILNGQFYEPKTHALVAELLQLWPGNMVHAGTFFGDMLPSFSKSCGAGGLVYAFEPLLENYVLARLNVDANRLENIVLFNSGLGERLGPCRIARGADSGVHFGGSSKISETGDVTSTIVTVDSLGLSQLSILQLDVEGFELFALLGAKATIVAQRPVVLVEDNERNCKPFLRSIDYQFAGAIPGLNMWFPQEKPQIGKVLSGYSVDN